MHASLRGEVTKAVICKKGLALLLWLSIIPSGCSGSFTNDLQQRIPFLELHSDSGDFFICDFAPDTGEVRQRRKMKGIDVYRTYTNWDWTKTALRGISDDDRQTYLYLYDLVNGRMEKHVFDNHFVISDWSKDGRFLLGYRAENEYVSYEEKSFGIFDTRKGEFVPIQLKEGAIAFFESDFLNRDEIIFNARDAYLYKLDISSTTQAELINQMKHSRYEISTSPDNRLIAGVFGETGSPCLSYYGIFILRNAPPYETVELLHLTSSDTRWYKETALTKEHIECASIYNLFWITNDELCFEIYDNRSSTYAVFYSLSEGVKAIKELHELQINAQNSRHNFLVSKDKRYVFIPTIVHEPLLNIFHSAIYAIDRHNNYRMKRLMKRKKVSIYFPEQIVGE